MGYEETNGVLRHPEGRRAVFLGDFIDRGPEIRRTHEIVRGMVEAGSALAVMGNHELNALHFTTPDPVLREEAALAQRIAQAPVRGDREAARP